ncbi:hypothetical protein D3C81_1867420 [compost metagenome]
MGFHLYYSGGDDLQPDLHRHHGLSPGTQNTARTEYLSEPGDLLHAVRRGDDSHLPGHPGAESAGQPVGLDHSGGHQRLQPDYREEFLPGASSGAGGGCQD